jgi:hypothetical protein
MEATMPKAGIVIDNWKLPIFERHLTKAGYAYKWTPGFTEDTGVLTVELTRPTEAATLHPIVKAANDEAARTKGKKQ